MASRREESNMGSRISSAGTKPCWDTLLSYINNYAEESLPRTESRRKLRTKSEKRSHSMTVWWAERQARKKEQEERNANGTSSKGLDRKITKNQQNQRL